MKLSSDEKEISIKLWDIRKRRNFNFMVKKEEKHRQKDVEDYDSKKDFLLKISIENIILKSLKEKSQISVQVIRFFSIQESIIIIITV